jgi:membrane protein implicated in regulation of membrane protease activity
MELLTADLTPWHWLIFGILLCVIELFLPTTFLLWAGIAALATGMVTFLAPILNWQLQIALFAVMAVTTTLAGRLFYSHDRETLAAPVLNRRGDSLVGRNFVLAEPIINGVGSATMDSTRWRITGPDTEAGTLMTVLSLDGASLVVQPADTAN